MIKLDVSKKFWIYRTNRDFGISGLNKEIGNIEK